MTNTADTGDGSLRAAITAANAAGGLDEIHFNIAGAGPHTISPASALPIIVSPVIIDGFTQSGSSANTNPLSAGLNTVLQIELDGTSAGASVTGLVVRTGGNGSTIRGLAINRFQGFGIFLDTDCSNNIIEGCFIGTNVAGTAALPNVLDGIQMQRGVNNLFGGSTPAAANLVSGNTLNGIVIVLSPSMNNSVKGNMIGTNAAGLAAIPNGFAGIIFVETTENVVGGSNPGDGNLISGNLTHGIDMISNGSRTTVQGNWIGTDRTGAAPLGNAMNGVNIDLSAFNQIGGFGEGGNVIAFNGGHGVQIRNFSSRCSIVSNSIHSNGGLGIELGTNGPNFPQDDGDADGGDNLLQNFPVITSVTDLNPGTRIQGFISTVVDSDYRLEFFANAAADSTGFGEGQTYLGAIDIHTDFSVNFNFTADVDSLPSGQTLVTATATDMTFRGAQTDPALNTSEFSPPFGDSGSGQEFVVTNTADSGADSLRAAIDAANASPGLDTIAFAIPADDPGHVYYMDDGVAGQVTRANIATTTATDDATITGIDPDWPHSWWTIAPASALVASDAITLNGYSQSAGAIAAVENTNPAPGPLNSILRIEINAEGAGNLTDGLLRLTAGGGAVRGLALNRSRGGFIRIQGGGASVIAGNYIGADVSGTLPTVPPGGAVTISARAGVHAESANNVIGGTTPAARNLLSGVQTLGGAGVFIEGLNATGNRVEGNLIGVTRSGMAALSNRDAGVQLTSAADNIIGGADAGAANVISGTAEISVAGTGVLIRNPTAMGNLVRGNHIGVNAGGDLPIPNDTGVEIDNAPQNEIVENIIGHSARRGVHIEGNSATGNLISRNSIFASGFLGIDLVSPVQLDFVNLPQDAQDADAGPNALQNFPSLTSVILGGDLAIQGEFHGVPSSNIRLEFFASPERHITGFGEGRHYLGSHDVLTDGAGDAAFSINLQAPPGGSNFVTATATDITDRGAGAVNDTSEFSGAYPINGCSLTVTNANDTGAGSLREAIYCANSLPGVDTITFNIPGGGPHLIIPSIKLPRILDPLVIDGYTQPGASANTNAIGQPLNSTILIRIDGANAGPFDSGLEILSGGCEVRGLAITGFADSGIYMETNGGNTIAGNYIGLPPDGSLPDPAMETGLYINRSADNILGGAAPADRNLISSNGWGIYVDGGGGDGLAAAGTLIQGNIIGADASGATPRGNGVGIEVQATQVRIEENQIAFNGAGIIVPDAFPGRPAGAETAILMNSIFSNTGLGIDLGDDGVTLNDIPPASDPPDQDDGANERQNFPVITSVDTGADSIAGQLQSLPNTSFRVEFFVSAAGDPTGFGEGEIFIGSADVTTDGAGFAAVAFNSPFDINDDHAVAATATRLSGGVPIETSEFSNRLGGSGCPLVVTNTLDAGAGSLREAILCANAQPGLDTITFNIPGDGPHVIQPSVELPGITDAIEIDGYLQPGAAVNTSPDGFNAVIKIVIDGSAGDPEANGLLLNVGGCVIRGLAIGGFPGVADPSNTFIFGGSGVSINEGGNTIEGCILGADATGMNPLPNFFGVQIINDQGGMANIIGGATPAARNLISGNAGSGVLIQETNGGAHAVLGNLIGVNAIGAAPLANGELGVYLLVAPDVIIGGAAAGEGNVISGNIFDGIALDSSPGAVIRGNWIGTNAAGAALGNGFAGVTIYGGSSTSGNCQVGGTAAGEGNVIAHNPGPGVTIDSDGGSGHSIRRNSIYENGALGIDLVATGGPYGGDGVTPNDAPPDSDAGGNGLVNFPVLTNITIGAGDVTIDGTLAAAPDTTYEMEFFMSDESDPSLHGEGQTFIGAANATTDGNGNATFSHAFSASVTSYMTFAATATAPDGSTSEFSNSLDWKGGLPCVIQNVVDFILGRTAIEPPCADANNDGEVNSADVILIYLNR